MHALAIRLYRDWRLLALLVTVLCLLGVSAFLSLPRMEDPETRVRWGWVLVRFPGASAEHVESLVTEKVERRLRELEAIKTIESQSSAGIAAIVVKLRDEVTDVNAIWSRLQDKLAQVAPELPAGTHEPEFIDTEWHSNTAILALTWDLEGPPVRAVLNRWAKEWRNRLRFIPGTMHAKLYGAVEEEIRVEVDPERLAVLGLDPRHLTRAIAASDSKVPAGVLRSPASNALLEVEGEIDSLERVRRIPIRHDDAAGGMLRLADVASVRKTVIDPPRELAVVDGRSSVALALRMEPGYRLDRWAENVREEVRLLRTELPQGIGAHLLFDQSKYTQSRLDELKLSLALGAGMVILLVLLLMGPRGVVPITAALPVTLLVALASMRVLGIPIHQMSMAGMIMALGLLIDNPVIMFDAIRKGVDSGRTHAEAIAGSMRLLAWPLTGSTLTTMLAFTPLLLVPGPVGEFLGPLATTVMLALGASLLLSLTCVPAVCAWFCRKPSGSGTSHGFGSETLYRLHRRFLNGILRRPLLGIAVGLILPAAGLACFGTLEEQFFPPAERDQFQVQLWLAPQASLEETRAAAAKAREALLRHPAITNVHWFLGTSAPKFYHNIVMGKEDLPYYAQAIVQLKESRNALAVIREVQVLLDDVLPDAQPLALQIEQGPPAAAPVELRIYGPDLDRLHALGEEVRSKLARVPDVTHTQATLQHGLPKFRLELNEERRQLVRLDNVGISRRLYAGLEGVVGGSLIEASEELPVRVRFPREADLVESLEVIPTGSEGRADDRLPLGSLGSLRLVPEVASISRRNGIRCNRVLGYLKAGVLPDRVESAFRRALSEEEFEPPPGYRFEFGGVSEERNASVEHLLRHVGVLALLIAAVLCLLYRSFRLATVIAAVAGLCFPLAFLALGLTGLPLGLVAIVGALGMVGVAINDSIVVLAAIRDDERARRGDRDAMRESVFEATRHVVTTSLTTAFGFLPLVYFGGELWPPMAVVMVVGMVGATILALTFVPCTYALFTRRRSADSSAAAPGGTPRSA